MTKEEAQALHDELWRDFSTGGDGTGMDYSKVDETYDRYQEINRGIDLESGPFGLHGAVHFIPFADGRACYQVLEVAHVEQLDEWMARVRRVPGVDDWTHPNIGWEGWTSLSAVESGVKRSQSPLFA